MDYGLRLVSGVAGRQTVAIYVKELTLDGFEGFWKSTRIYTTCICSYSPATSPPIKVCVGHDYNNNRVILTIDVRPSPSNSGSTRYRDPT